MECLTYSLAVMLGKVTISDFCLLLVPTPERWNEDKITDFGFRYTGKAVYQPPDCKSGTPQGSVNCF
jgi:hypothetical protein